MFRNFLRFSKSFDDIMGCRWGNPQFHCYHASRNLKLLDSLPTQFFRKRWTSPHPLLWRTEPLVPSCLKLVCMNFRINTFFTKISEVDEMQQIIVFVLCGSGNADTDHGAARVPAGRCGQQGGFDLQSLWSTWTQLPVVQRQRGGQRNINRAHNLTLMALRQIMDYLLDYVILQIMDEMGCAPELVLCPLSPVHQGHYICRVNYGDNCIFSQWAQVRIIHSAGNITLFLLVVPLVLFPLMVCV